MIYAKYTIVLKTLLDDPQSKELIDKVLSTYPLYSPEHSSKFTQVMSREEINKRILDHFKYREIGFETFGRFLDELEIAMNEIMPYYNQLFVSEDIINGLEDIFGNLDVKEEFKQEITGTSNSTSNETQDSESNVKGSNTANSKGSDSSTNNNIMVTDNKDVSSDTPQSQLTITAKDIDNVNYANNVKWSKNNSENTGTSTGETETESSSNSNQDTTGSVEINKTDSDTTSNSTSHTLTRKGNQGVNTYAHDMLEFRGLFINIVQKIINDDRIQELFMQVY